MEERNEINNSLVKEKIANDVLSLLVSNNFLTREDLPYVNISFGYIFTTSENMIEALLKLNTKENKEFYFAVQKNQVKLININDNIFNDTISKMKEFHECLREEQSLEKNDQSMRKQQNINYLKNNNISFSESLSCLYNDKNMVLKTKEEVCKRAIACLIVVQIACDINNNMYEESKKVFIPMLEKYNVQQCLNSKEKRIIDGNYTEQDVIDLDWAYESYWALCWYLGLVNDIKNASMLCDCSQAISFVSNCSSFEEFYNKCNIRSIEELLDMEDLYYRYNWAINEKEVNPNASIGNLNPSNVIERRRALEWIISAKADWYDIELNA